jgi:NAD(P)H-dependent FMN reductase
MIDTFPVFSMDVKPYLLRRTGRDGAPQQTIRGSAMSKPRIGIIISTTREARFGDKPAAWIKAIADGRGDIATEIVDLRDYPMPFFDDVAGPAYAPTSSPTARAWKAKLAEFDGYLIVTAEYNHSPTGVLSNALDFLHDEVIRKPVAFVGYGGVGAARAIEQLRQIAVELQMAPTRSAVHIAGADFFAVWQQGKSLDDLPHLLPSAKATLDDLVWWTNALRSAREGDERALREQRHGEANDLASLARNAETLAA